MGAVRGTETGNTDLVNQSLKLGVLGVTGDTDLANSIGASSSSSSSSAGSSDCSDSDQSQVAKALQDMNSQGVCNGAGQRYVNLVKRLAGSGQCGYTQSHVANAKAQCNSCITVCN